MFSNFLFAAKRYRRLCYESLCQGTGSKTPTLKGKLFRICLFTGFFPIWMIHWLCFFLDEVFFPDYQMTEIREPVLVLGVPRSGTTFLHRTLAADTERFTTLSTWEVFFAPTIIQRKFLLFLSAIDRRIGAYGARLLAHVERALFQEMEGVHDMSLAEPEEDYLLLLSIFATFIMVLPFSRSETIWRLSRLDTEMPEPEKEQILSFYKACLQKHLYVHGTDRRFLSKNAAFASWVGGLRDYFPDAGFVFCFRDPDKAIPSLLGSMKIGGDLFEIDLAEGKFAERMTLMMRFNYRHLLTGDRDAAMVHMDDLQDDLQGAVAAIYDHLGISLTPHYQQRLAEITHAAKSYRSKARHIQPCSRHLNDDFFEEQFMEYYQWKQNRKAR